MIHLDTCVLIDALTGPRRSAPAMRSLIAQGERLEFSALVLFEWRRGTRHPDELHVQESLFPSDAAVAFGPAEARLASELYSLVRRPRGREIDLAIAASALLQHAVLWTLNPGDFEDIPGLQLFVADAR